MAAIVVPFRGAEWQAAARSLPDDARCALALAMLADVLAACRGVGTTVVVTRRRGCPDRGRARRGGLGDPGGGQGAAVAAALRDAGRSGARRERGRPVRRPARPARAGGGRARRARVVAASDGTTNALGLRRPGSSHRSTAPGSAARFRMHAHTIGADVVPTAIPNLADDVDSLGRSRTARASCRTARVTRLAARAAVKVTVLRGGVGGARFVRGLVDVVRPRRARP